MDARSSTALKRSPEQVVGAIHLSVKELDQAVKGLPRKHTLIT